MNARRTLVTMVAVICLATLGIAARAQDDVFLRGDANADGQISVSDATTINRSLFGSPLPCMDAADITDDGSIDLRDVLTVLQLMRGRISGSDIPAPFPEAGADPTEDRLGCEGYEIEPPEQTDDFVLLEDVTAAPGQSVEIPVYVSSSVDFDAAQIVVDYDPAVFTPGTNFIEVSNHEETRLTTWPEFGVFMVVIAGVGPDDNDDETFPAGDGVLIGEIPGTISADVEPGAVLSLEVRTEGFGEQGLRTELSLHGEARLVSINYFFPRRQ